VSRKNAFWLISMDRDCKSGRLVINQGMHKRSVCRLLRRELQGQDMAFDFFYEWLGKVGSFIRGAVGPDVVLVQTEFRASNAAGSLDRILLQLSIHAFTLL
jgi:hypothetical protein